MATRFSVSAIFSAVDRMTGPVRKMQMSTKAFSRSVRRDFMSAQRQAETMTSSFGSRMGSVIRMGALAGAAGIGYLAVEGIKLASDLTEVQNVVDTTFGANSKTIDEWSKNAITQFGLSELQAKQFTGSLGAMMASSGLTGDKVVEMSTKLSGLAGDFASFYNLPIEEAFEKIRSGISGETEPLKRLGINMSVANMEAFALSQGLTKKWKAMTQAEQTTMRYNYLMKVTANAQGDFAKTLMTSLANQQRVLKTNFMQKLADSMKSVLPKITNIFIKLNETISSIDSEAIGKAISSIVDTLLDLAKVVWVVLKVIGPFIPLILSMALAWMVYKKTLLAVAIVQNLMKMQMNRAALAFALLAGLIFYLITNWSKFSNTTKTWIKIGGGLVGIIGTIIGLYKAWVAIQGILNIVMALNPIGLTIIAVAALIAGVVLLIKYWDIVKSGMISFGKAIMRALLWPINQVMYGIIKLLYMATKIPGIGKHFVGAALGAIDVYDKINKPFQESEKPATTKPTVTTQREATTTAIQNNNSTQTVVIENQSGQTVRNNGKKVNTGTSLKLQASGG